MDGSGIIKEIGRSFIYSAFMPAAFFCIAALYAFHDFFSLEYFNQMKDNNLITVIGQWILLLIIPTWIAFFLFSSIDWITKFYCGEFLPSFIRKPLVDYNIRKLQKKAQSYFIIKEILARPVELRTIEDDKTYDEHWASAMAELQELEMQMPLNEIDIMPTQLGNVLRASEAYAEERYYVDPIHAWPRLFAVLPRQFILDMEEKHNRLMFLLNSSLLAFILGSASFVIWIVGQYQSTCLPNKICTFLKNQEMLQKGFAANQPVNFLILSIIFFVTSYFIYNIGANAAQDFSLFYRAGFDVYRNDLLKCLHCEPPQNIGEERNRWLEISGFFYAGEKMTWDKNMVKYPFYHVHKKSESEQTKIPFE
jgi:hypothetical protein